MVDLFYTIEHIALFVILANSIGRRGLKVSIEKSGSVHFTEHYHCPVNCPLGVILFIRLATLFKIYL